jgi:transposase
MVTVGLDLHKRYITACALDDAGTVLAEARRLDPTLDALARWFGALPQPVTVALEATLYWHWLERHLTALGRRVVVAHPYQVKLIWQARAKTDRIDARKLAELARVNLLPAIWIPAAADERPGYIRPLRHARERRSRLSGKTLAGLPNFIESSRVPCSTLRQLLRK